MKLKLKNIGPFKDTFLSIGDLTVIAGVNDTGKSYLSKILFCLITSQGRNFWNDIEKSFADNVLTFFFAINESTYFFADKSKFESNLLNKLLDSKILTKSDIQSLQDSEKLFQNLNKQNEDFYNQWFSNNFQGDYKFNEFLKKFMPEFERQIEENKKQISLFKKVEKLYYKLHEEKSISKKVNVYFFDMIPMLEYTARFFFKEVQNILFILNESQQETIYSYLISNIFEKNFKETIKNKKYLTKESMLNLEINEKNFKIVINDTFYVLDEKNLYNNFNEVFYFDNMSEISNDFINFIQNKSKLEFYNSLRFRRNRSLVLFELKNLNYKAIWKSKLQQNEEIDSLNDVIDNRQLLKELNDFFNLEINIDLQSGILKKDGIEINLENTSQGVKIIESFKTLIKKNFFKTDNLIIFDELENHLHPEWQRLIVLLLLKIIEKNKCKVVISTHSPFIIETISSYTKRDFKNIDVKYNFVDKSKDKGAFIEEEKIPLKIRKALSIPYRELDEYEFKFKTKK